MHRKMIIADLMSTGSAEEAEAFAYKVCVPCGGRLGGRPPPPPPPPPP